MEINKELLGLFLLALLIPLNNLGMAFALGALGQAHRKWRIIGVFAFFEFLMPLIGLSSGKILSKGIEQKISWIGPLILLIMGFWCIQSAFKRQRSDNQLMNALSSWKALVLLELGLSIDNFAIGFGLGVGNTELPVFILAAAISGVAAIYTWIAIRFAAHFKRSLEFSSKIFAGFALIVLAALDFFDFF